MILRPHINISGKRRRVYTYPPTIRRTQPHKHYYYNTYKTTRHDIPREMVEEQARKEAEELARKRKATVRRLNGKVLFTVQRPVRPEEVIRRAKLEHGLEVDGDLLKAAVAQNSATGADVYVASFYPAVRHVFQCNDRGVLPDITRPSRGDATTIVINRWRTYNDSDDGKKVDDLRAIFDGDGGGDDTTVYTLAFQDCRLTTAMAQRLFRRVDGRQPFPMLERLDLGNSLCSRERDVRELITLLANNVLRNHARLLALDISKNSIRKPEGVIALANAIRANGALEKLLMANNKIATKEAGEALGQALANNSVLKELDISSNGFYNNSSDKSDGPGFARGIADGIKNNRALSKLIFGGDKYTDYSVDPPRQVSPEPALLEVGMTEADLSNKSLGTGGAIIVGAWISQKDNGALLSLNISNNQLIGRSDHPGKALSEMLQVNSTLTELDVSNNAPFSKSDSIGFAKELAVGLGANGALVKFDISNNKLYAAGVVALAGAISTNGALVKLIMGANCLTGEGAGKALGDAIATNTVLKELDLSSAQAEYDFQKCDAGFAKGFSAGLGANGALTSLDISSNNLVTKSPAVLKKDHGLKPGDMVEYNGLRCPVQDQGKDGYHVWMMHGVAALADAIPTMGALAKLIFGGDTYTTGFGRNKKEITPESATLEVGMTEADLSNKNLGIGGAIIVGAWISHKDNGALVKFNISDNSLCTAGAKTLAECLKDNQVITELNIANNHLGKVGTAWDAESDMSGLIAISSAIPTMGALEKFDISDNDIRAEGARALAEALKDNAIMKVLNIASNGLGYNRSLKTDMSGVIAIGDTIPTMGAMVKFDISNNDLRADDLQRIIDLCNANHIELVLYGSLPLK